MRISGRRCSALLIGAVLALSACDGGDDPVDPKPSASASTSPAPTLPVVTPAATFASLTVAKKARWTTTTLRRGKAKSASVVGDTAIVSFESGSVAAVGTATGKVRWSYRRGQAFKNGRGQELAYDLGPDVVTESAAGPLVIVDSYGRNSDSPFGLAALSVKTGRMVWAKPLSARGSLSHDWQLRIIAATRGGTVLLRRSGSSSEGRYAVEDVETVVLDTATGRIRWRHAGAAPDALAGSSVIAVGPVDGAVAAFGIPSGPLIARDLQTGRTLWQRPASEIATSIGAPTRRTVFAAVANRTRLLDAATGRVLWTTSASSLSCRSDDSELAACLVRGTLVTYAATDGVIRQGAVKVAGNDYGIDLIDSGRVYLDRDDGPATVVDRSGRVLGSRPAGEIYWVSSRQLVVASQSNGYDAAVLALYEITS